MSKMPSNVSFIEAAALPIAAESAITGLEKGGLSPGHRVLIIGGSGGVGSAAIPIAKLMGATYVSSVNSSRNTEYVKRLGADAVIEYDKGLDLDSGTHKDYDVVLDCVGGREQWEHAQLAMKMEDRLSRWSVMMQAPTRCRWLALLQKSLVASAGLWVPSWKLKVAVDKVYPFTKEGVVDAYNVSAKGHTRGKLVVELVKVWEVISW
jgi:NADPH:quinone reductase-like Zn-dependent oxidoreductase